MVGDAFLSKVYFEICKTVQLLFVKAVGSTSAVAKEKCYPGMFCSEVLKYQTSS